VRWLPGLCGASGRGYRDTSINDQREPSVRKARVDAKTSARKLCYFLPAAFRLAAHLAFIASESFLLPAAVSPPFFLPGALALAAGALVVPFRLAHRAFAEAASFARVAADIGLRLRERRRLELEPLALVELIEAPLPKSVDNRRSSVLICCLSERASVSLLRDKSISTLDSSVRNNCKRNTTTT
jgi:hypothetical protein